MVVLYLFFGVVCGGVAVASEYAATVKSYLVETVKNGGKPVVHISMAPGEATPSTILAINEDGLRVNARGAELNLTWKMVGDEKGLYEMARPLIPEAPSNVHAAYLQWSAELGHAKEAGFRRLLEKLWEKDSAEAKQVEDGLGAAVASSPAVPLNGATATPPSGTLSATPKGMASRKTVPVPDHLNVKDLTPVKGLEPVKHEPIVLVRDGAPLAKVYLAEAKPRKNIQVMVQELVDSIRLTTDAELQVIRHSPAPPPSGGVPVIVIGDCEASRAAGIDASKIPVEGFVVKTTADRVFLVGSTMPIPDLGGWPPSYGNDGTAWAIADFLERCVGVRWYWPLNVGGRSVVESKTLAINPAHYCDEPVFRKREYFPQGTFPRNSSPLWYDEKAPGPTERAIPAGVEKVDVTVCLTALRQGFSWPYLIKVHDPQQIWKNQGIVDHHPEIFRLEKDGKRCYSQLCYGSQATFNFLIAGCEAVWDKKQHNLPNWDNHYVTWVTGTSVTVSPFDMPLDCACEACQPILTAKGGGPSKLMCLFVKKMCEEVKRRWPDKKVMYLPYWNYTWPAEGVEFPDNLEIQLCTSTTGLPRNPQGLDKGLEWKISAWNKITHDRIQTWEYTGATNRTYALYQFPHTLKEYYSRNRDLLAGSFINGGCLNDWAVYSITHHCWMKVLWNPDVDVDAIMDVFCERMFGKASKLAREFLRIECDRYEKSGASPGTGDGHENTGGIRSMFPPKVVAEMTQLWEQARLELKDDPTALQRFEYFTWTFEHFVKGYQGSSANGRK